MRVFCPHCMRPNYRKTTPATGGEFASDRCDYCGGVFWADRYGQVKREKPAEGKTGDV
jgi:hypothetical protein